MGKNKDFSMFIKSGHILRVLSGVYSCLKAVGKNGIIKLTEKFAILQYTIQLHNHLHTFGFRSWNFVYHHIFCNL